MILPALNTLYDRLIGDEKYGIAPTGWSIQKVSFCIVLEEDGYLHDIQDARQPVATTLKSGKTNTTHRLMQVPVPGKTKPSGSGINPCTLWDNAGYLLGYKTPDLSNTEETGKKQKRAQETFTATRKHHLALENQINTPPFSAVCRFLEQWNPSDINAQWIAKLDNFATTGNGVFRIIASREYVHDTEAFKQWYEKNRQVSMTKEQTGICLATGRQDTIARLHEPAVKGVAGAAPSGAKLASFNQPSFESYAKDQSYNAPVATTVVSHYGKALNALLDGPQNKRHRMKIGDATTVFWTERATKTESLFASFFRGDVDVKEADGELNTEEDGLMQDRLDAFLNTLRRGGGGGFDVLEDDPDTRFYILGLSGNKSRLAVRFWHVCTIRELLERLRGHFELLALYRHPDADRYHEPEFPSAERLLAETARKDDISPILGGQLMHAILQGTPYPMTLLNGIITRIRAGEKITYLKAAILKAVLTRNLKRTIDMSLNTERTDPAYLLGRLFAALQKTQEDALGREINAGLRERYYSSASATPGSVFPRILRTYQHHLAKLETPVKISREQLVQSIHVLLDDYPSQLGLADQGLFAIGYYHQRQYFFIPKGKQADDPASGTEETPLNKDTIKDL